ncbi:hypothetical protein B9C88_21485 [Brevibacillus laterosporus]|uniref:phage head-tail connector protein n=1 Tax=Brevibacillus laterosporus TaxID=1465 RepID=UPI000BCB452E|nr:phage head-tail connector protein [Brevibacillus laterosporus]PCN42275.1 hypothetical protein B9C88_21485 [Brevibacillus laterosporus]
MHPDQILALIKELAGITDDSKDNKIKLYLRQVERKVKNHCNIEEIPEQLWEIVAEMVVQVLLSGDDSQIIEGSGAVKRVTRGDYTVEYDVGSKVATTGASLDDVLTNYKSQLNRFRRMRVVK